MNRYIHIIILVICKVYGAAGVEGDVFFKCSHLNGFESFGDFVIDPNYPVPRYTSA
jgi:hypothetical protein